MCLTAALALPAAAPAKPRPWAPSVTWAVPWAGQAELRLAQQERHKSKARKRQKRSRDHDGDHDSDHDRARDAVSAGKALPLQQILQRLGRRYPGRLLDADLDRDRQGRWIYRLKLLAPGDQVQRLTVDAQSGRVLQSKRQR